MKRPTYLIRNGLLLTMDPDETNSIIKDGAVLIRDGKILDCGFTADVLSRRQEIIGSAPIDKEIDARGNIIMPGLVNCHTHLPMSMFRGLADDLPLDTWLNDHIFPAEATRLNETSVKQWALHSCREMLLGGTTTCCDGYFFENQVAEAVARSGMRAVLGHGIIDFPAPGVPNPEENVAVAERFVERWKGRYSRITPSIFCHAPYTCSPDTLKKAKETANAHGVLFQIHVSETKTEIEAVRQTALTQGKEYEQTHGKEQEKGEGTCKGNKGKNKGQIQDQQISPRSVVAYLDNLGVLDEKTVLVHTVWIDEKDMNLIRKRSAKVAHCPESNMKLASGIAPVWELITKNITVGLGTDGCASNNSHDLFGEMSMAAKLQKIHCMDPCALDAHTVVKMATIDGAKAIGLDHLIGSITPGKRADIILLDTGKPHMVPIYNPWSAIVYGAKASDVTLTMVDGTILMENGTLKERPIINP